MKKFSYIFALLMASAIALLAACGGSEPAPEAAAPEELNITVVGTDDFKWDPETITVASGTKVNLTLDNQGALEHNWILASNTTDVATATDADALYGANVGYVQGGDKGELSFKAPGPGTYLYVCTVAGHAAGGMVGELIVE